jgi:hypothetical protein
MTRHLFLGAGLATRRLGATHHDDIRSFVVLAETADRAQEEALAALRSASPPSDGWDYQVRLERVQPQRLDEWHAAVHADDAVAHEAHEMRSLAETHRATIERQAATLKAYGERMDTLAATLAQVRDQLRVTTAERDDLAEIRAFSLHETDRLGQQLADVRPSRDALIAAIYEDRTNDPHYLGGYRCRLCNYDVDPTLPESHNQTCGLYESGEPAP